MILYLLTDINYGLKIMRNKFLLLGLLSSIALQSQALDDNNSPSSYGYAQFNGGVGFLKSGSGAFGNNSQGSTGVYGIEGGYKFDDYTRFSLGLDYYSEHSFSTPGDQNTSGTASVNIGGNNVNIPYSQSSTNNFKVSSWVAMVNGYYDFKNETNFMPYLTLGLGASFNKAKSTYNTAGIVNGSTVVNLNTNLAQKETTNFAYKAGIGVRYSLNKLFDLDLRYQFVDLGKFTTSSGSTVIDGVTEQAAEQTVKLKSQEISLGIAYKF